MTTPVQYNAAQLASGALSPKHVVELVRYWQKGHRLVADGMAGPKTLASLEAELTALVIGADHWIVGATVVPVTRLASHMSWFGGAMPGDGPAGIVWHYTATDPGTALRMAQTRTQQYRRDLKPNISSWHASIETDGTIVQMIPFHRAAWHAGGSTAQPVRGLGTANYSCVGLELVGHGTTFPDAQVRSAKLLARALVRRYAIVRPFAMLQHSQIDPTQRRDPGPVWMAEHAAAVADFAFA
jgi:hypothetical protein